MLHKIGKVLSITCYDVLLFSINNRKQHFVRKQIYIVYCIYLVVYQLSATEEQFILVLQGSNASSYLTSLEIVPSHNMWRCSTHFDVVSTRFVRPVELRG